MKKATNSETNEQTTLTTIKQIFLGVGSALVIIPIITLMLNFISCSNKVCIWNYELFGIGETIFGIGIILIVLGYIAHREIKKLKKLTEE